jgi:cytochrome P450
MNFRYKPASDEFQNDPHSIYDNMREHYPIYFTNNRYVVLTRYEDVATTLKNPKVSVQFMDYCEGKAAEYVRPIRELRETNPIIGHFTTMLRVDDPAHDRMKHLTIKHFSHANILKLAGQIEELVDTRIQAIKNNTTVDIADTVSRHLPVDVTFIILGLPDEDKEKLTHWAHALTTIVEPLQSSTDGIQYVLDLLPDTVTYLVNKIEERRANPKENDVVTDLIYGTYDGETIPYEELVSTVGLLFMAGIETTLFFLANALHALTVDKEARAQWIEISKTAREKGQGFYTDKTALNAIDELMRYCGSVWMTGRVNIEDLHYHADGKDYVVPKGSIVHPIMAAANRDPRVFPNPHKLDLYRSNAGKQLGFGGGPHFCLGSHLARLETLILLDRVFTEFPNLELAEQPIWRKRVSFRGIENLLINLNNK